jgi:Tfp pilus assembly protein FimV
MKSTNRKGNLTSLVIFMPMLWLFLFSSGSHGLGLGNLQALSYLGEPLEATIAITAGNNEDYGLEQLRVRQLSNKQAAALGIDLARSFASYRFSLSDQNGRLSIMLKGSEPVDEPYLNFLVELKWPTGTVYREYTLFLDPPGFQTVLPSRLPKPKAKPPVVPEDKDVNADLAVGSSRYGVRSGDSLSKIAASLVKGTDTSRSDMMNWLVANNPQAFKNGDMNRMLAGASLRLPEKAQLSQQPQPRPDPASSEQAPADNPLEAAPIANEKAPQNEPVKSDEMVTKERLTIVTPNTSRSSVSAEELSQAETILALQDTVVATQELADRMKRDNEAMLKRLQAIESSDYISSMERLVALKEQEILALKTELANKALQQKELADNAANNKTNDGGVEGTLQRWLLILLLAIALIGTAYFFYRWRLMQPAEKFTKSRTLSDEQALLNELDAMAVPSPKTAQDDQQDPLQVLKATRQGFTNLGRKARDADRRSEDEIKQSIREKTNNYIPDILAGKNESDYDDLDRLISEALQAANQGKFGVAESLLLAERTEQVRKPSKRENDGSERLEAAISYVDQLRQIKYSQHFKD